MLCNHRFKSLRGVTLRLAYCSSINALKFLFNIFLKFLFEGTWQPKGVAKGKFNSRFRPIKSAGLSFSEGRWRDLSQQWIGSIIFFYALLTSRNISLFSPVLKPQCKQRTPSWMMKREALKIALSACYLFLKMKKKKELEKSFCTTKKFVVIHEERHVFLNKGFFKVIILIR